MSVWRECYLAGLTLAVCAVGVSIGLAGDPKELRPTETVPMAVEPSRAPAEARPLPPKSAAFRYELGPGDHLKDSFL